MKYPSSVTIYGAEYQIQVEKDLVLEGVACDGLCYIKERKILIDSSIKDPAVFKEILIHEMGHALMDRLGFNLLGIPPELEELLVQGIAVMVTESFKLSFNNS